MEKKEKKNELDRHKNPRILFKLACKTTLSRDFFRTETLGQNTVLLNAVPFTLLSSPVA